MAVTAFGLALFLICLSATHVSCQEVTVQQVSTTSLVLTWEKEGQWEDVNTYHVKVKEDGNDFCETTVMCFLSSTCTFTSKNSCGMFFPCATVSVTVKGGNYTVPVDVITAPAPVTDIAVSGTGNVKSITWTNPTSKCFVSITTQVTYRDYYSYTTPLGHDEESLTVSLCMKGSGSVTVRAIGGSGESDPASIALIRLSGDDAVTITACPPEGCTDVVVQWEYNNKVCSDVDHFNVTLEDDIFTTTNVTTTSTTFKDLELNTQYDTCVYALDKEDNVLARHCKSCGTYPEVVEQLTVTNVTDSMAEIEWEPPICPTDGDIAYLVSYSLSGVEHTNITTQTSFLWTSLNPGVNYNLCVTVLHEDVPSAKPNCISAFTLPAAPEEVLARVYEETSLFITWSAQLFQTNHKYRVSWGDDLEHSDYTEYFSYTIDGYNKTVGPNKVCVEVETKKPNGLRSTKICQESPFPNFKPDKPDNTAMIIGVSVSGGLAVALSLVLVVVAKMQDRPSRGS